MGLPIPGLAQLTAADGPLANLALNAEAMAQLAEAMTASADQYAALAKSNTILADSNYQLANAINDSTSKRR